MAPWIFDSRHPGPRIGTLTVTLINNGLGPALIDDVCISVDEKTLPNPRHEHWDAAVIKLTLLDLKEIPLGKSRLDLALQGGNFGDLSGAWILGSGIPGLLLNTNLFPLRDFLGRPFPRRTSIALNNWVSLTITIENGLPLASSPDRKNHLLLAQLLDSLAQIPRNRLAATLTCYALACSETPVIIPRWWKNLTSESRRAAWLNSMLQRVRNL